MTRAILFLIFLSPIALAQDAADLNHKGIIESWDDESLERGRKLYQACAGCHGLDGNSPLHPTARAFGRDEFKFGSDPYSMFRTITYGNGAMLSQTWLSPSERYDVIHYLREALIQPTNENMYVELSDDYLNGLPKGASMGQREGRGSRDYGPVLMSQIERRVNRAATFFLPGGFHASYDLHRMVLSDVWRGELDLSETQHKRLRGERQPVPEGERFDELLDWYWCFGEGLEPAPSTMGEQGIDGGKPSTPLPENLVRYSGRYVHGRHAALAYTIGNREVLETPGVTERGDGVIMHHTLLIFPGDSAMRLCVGQQRDDGWPITTTLDFLGTASDEARVTGTIAATATEDDRGEFGRFIAASVVGDTEELAWAFDDALRIGLVIPSSTEPLRLRIYRIAGEGRGVLESFTRFMRARHEEGEFALPDMNVFREGGPRIWRDTIATSITLDDEALHYDPVDYEEPNRRRGLASRAHVPYVMDTIALPEPNPWNAWMRMSAIDFFDDGRAAVSTLGGDVWIVDGLDGETAQWTRYASGMFEPLGIKVVDGEIYVTCRGGIVKLHDLNDDGQADFYENFYPDPNVSNGFHAYNFDLERDAEGYFYYIKPGLYTDFTQAGAVVKVAPDGSRGEYISTGFRVPNGLTLAGDTLYASDNQGQWTPANEINIIKRDTFYGVSQSGKAQSEKWEKPMIFLPQEFDNSPGDMAVADDERFGPLSGYLINTSFGKGWMYYVMPNETGAAAIAFPFQLQAGVQRAATNPADGQMYAVGLTGWDTEAEYAEGCFHRIRYTDDTGCIVTNTEVVDDGIVLTFSSPVDAESLMRVRFKVEQWNYRWTKNYGSDDWSVDDPNEEGRDRRAVTGIALSDESTRVQLTIPDLKPAHTTRINFEARSHDGIDIRDTVYMTIHELR